MSLEPRESKENTGLPASHILRLLKGLGILAVCLLICWFLFGRYKIIPIIAGISVVIFLFYCIYVFADLRIKPPVKADRRNRPPKPAVYYISEYTPTAYSYVKQKKGNAAEKEGMVYRAHWAYFVRQAIIPILLLLCSLVTIVVGITRDWEIFEVFEIKAALLILVVVFIFWIIYALIDWSNDLYFVGDERIADINRKPFAKKEVTMTLISKIQSVQYKKSGIFQYLFDYGTIKILSGESELLFVYVPHPDKVQLEIIKQMEANDAKKQLNDPEKQPVIQNDRTDSLIHYFNRKAAKNRLE